jgi:hypothetical protein
MPYQKTQANRAQKFRPEGKKMPKSNERNEKERRLYIIRTITNIVCMMRVLLCNAMQCCEETTHPSINDFPIRAI